MTPAEKHICRIAINLGNALLATPDRDGHAKGVSVDMARAWCAANQLEAEWLLVDNAREAVALLENEAADLGFLAIDPSRAAHLQFTRPYLNIDGCYLVKDHSLIHHHSEVDNPKHRVVVGLGSAYDLFLSRHLKAAQLVKAPSSKEVVHWFIKQEADVAAGVKQQLMMDMQTHKGLRMLPEAFMQIQQAMVIHQGRGAQALERLQVFLNDYISGGKLARSMEEHQVTGASITAPDHH